MIEDSLLVVTDAAGIKSLSASECWRPLALRVDQLSVDSILFLDVDSGVIEYVAFLRSGSIGYFNQWCDGPDCYEGTFTPEIAAVDELLTSLKLDVDALHFMATLVDEGDVLMHHEAFTIRAVDGFMAVADTDPEEGAALLGSEVIDQLVRNRRDPVASVGRDALSSRSVGDAIALQAEQLPLLGFVGEPLRDLPYDWLVAGGDESTLYLLNSAYQQQPAQGGA